MPPPPAELNGRPVWAPEALAAQVAFYEETLGALGREVGEEALAHLHHRLVTDVAYVDLSRTMFKDTVWTQIEWSRALGHPTEEPMHAGFDVQAKYLLIHGVVSAGGLVHNTSHWVDTVEVRSWDGPHDDETFRVGVMARGQSPWFHWIGDRSARWRDMGRRPDTLLVAAHPASRLPGPACRPVASSSSTATESPHSRISRRPLVSRPARRVSNQPRDDGRRAGSRGVSDARKVNSEAAGHLDEIGPSTAGQQCSPR